MIDNERTLLGVWWLLTHPNECGQQLS